MDLLEIPALQERIAALVLRDAPPQWDRLELSITAAGGWARFGCYAITGELRELYGSGLGIDAGVAATDLRTAMLDPVTGTWLSMLCTIDPDHAYHFTFNYDQPITAGGRELEPETIEREFTDHPRPWDLIPQWTHIKATYTEHEWDARRKMLARKRARIRAKQRRSDAIRSRLGLPLR